MRKVLEPEFAKLGDNVGGRHGSEEVGGGRRDGETREENGRRAGEFGESCLVRLVERGLLIESPL